MIEIAEMFEAPQGEGRFMGRQSLYVRVHRCPLKCAWCDSKFTWDKTDPDYGKGVVTYAAPQDLSDAMWDFVGDKDVKEPNPMAVVFTGGEPMLYQDALASAIDGFRMYLPNFAVEMETSGFIAPNDAIRKRCHFNVSQKLPGAENKHVDASKLLNVEATEVFLRSDADFKVVVSKEDKDEDIELYVGWLKLRASRVGLDWNLVRQRIYLMPEGTTGYGVKMHQPRAISLAQRLGVLVTTRMHIIAYDNKRGK